MRSASSNPQPMADADYGFHLAIIRLRQNEVFELIYSPISKFLWHHLSERMQLFDPAETIRLHDLIFQSNQNCDIEAARRGMKSHLEIGYTTDLNSQNGEFSGGGTTE